MNIKDVTSVISYVRDIICMQDNILNRFLYIFYVPPKRFHYLPLPACEQTIVYMYVYNLKRNMVL